MKPRVYIETTIPSYLTAWPSGNVIRAVEQQQTREWWAVRDAFELFVSRLVLVECGKGDPTAAAERLAVLNGIDALEPNDDATFLAEEISRRVRIPTKASADALHIAASAVFGIEYLITWNCRHIADPDLLPRIESVCRELGYTLPRICTPPELMPEAAQ